MQPSGSLVPISECATAGSKYIGAEGCAGAGDESKEDVATVCLSKSGSGKAEGLASAMQGGYSSLTRYP